MQPLSLDVVVSRAGVTESRHRVHAAVVDAGGTRVAGARTAELVAPWRSCAKFFQLLPLLASGGFDRLGWGTPQLALACASHGGEPEHVAVASAMLRDLGLEEGDLACGPHEPLASRGARLLREGGGTPGRLHNNCSGKHAAMLARAITAGWSPQGYERVDHPVQRGCIAEVSSWSGVPQEDMPLGVDGCGVVVMALPLDRMALAYARLAAAMHDGDPLPAAIAQAVRAHPMLLGGTDRFDTVVLEATEGRVITKVGAEGVHCAAIPERGLGVAVKVEDGAQRAQHAALVAALAQLGVFEGGVPARLADWAVRPVRNTRGEQVGELRVELPHTSP